MRGRAVFAALAVALAVAGFVLGLEEAKANPWRYGEPHGCPAGAAPSKCFYPPDLHAQRFAYSVNGLLLGLSYSLRGDGRLCAGSALPRATAARLKEPVGDVPRIAGEERGGACEHQPGAKKRKAPSARSCERQRRRADDDRAQRASVTREAEVIEAR